MFDLLDRKRTIINNFFFILITLFLTECDNVGKVQKNKDLINIKLICKHPKFLEKAGWPVFGYHFTSKNKAIAYTYSYRIGVLHSELQKEYGNYKLDDEYVFLGEDKVIAIDRASLIMYVRGKFVAQCELQSKKFNIDNFFYSKPNLPPKRGKNKI